MVVRPHAPPPREIRESTSGNLVLVLSRRCNLSCRYCPVDKNGGLMHPDVARGAIREHGVGADLVRLTGGEPTLNWPAVEAVVDEMETSGSHSRLELCTNGTLIDEGRARWLDRDWIRVVVSIDGTREQQAASGRAEIPALDRILALPGATVTQTIGPEGAGTLLDGFLHLWEVGARAFNFLPVYYVRWSSGQVRALREGLGAVADFLRPRVLGGLADVHNLQRRGSVPLFNDDLTVDVDGARYRTNLVLADRIAGSLVDDLRGRDGRVPPVPAHLTERLLDGMDPAVARSTVRVDEVLNGFVERLSGAPAPSKGDPGRSRRPERLELHISYDCTNRCGFCSETHRMRRWAGHPLGAMEINRAIRSHAGAGGTHVNLTGGEPSLHPAFYYALDLCRRSGLRTWVGTNGFRLADPGFADRALDLVDELSLSLHGSNAGRHDALTGRRGSFDDLVKLAGYAAGRPIDLFANCVVMRDNVDDLPDVVRLCARLGVPRLLLSNVAPEGRALDRYDELVTPLEGWKRLAPFLVAEASRVGVDVRFFGLPLCVLGSARMKSNDLYFDPRVTVERARGRGDSVRLSTVITRLPRRGRRKTRACRGCLMARLCGGVFREQIDAEGDSALEAIRD